MAKPKILIVDDEELLVKSTCMALELNEYDPVGALDAEEGLAKAESFKPDLILLDIMMPGMDGWQMLQKLKQNNATRSIPVIIFTAKEYANGKALAESKGAVDYVAKPFRLDDLDALLKSYLRKGDKNG
jgi:two-component system KDP operon response regulator KdpE